MKTDKPCMYLYRPDSPLYLGCSSCILPQAQIDAGTPSEKQA